MSAARVLSFLQFALMMIQKAALFQSVLHPPLVLVTHSQVKTKDLLSPFHLLVFVRKLTPSMTSEEQRDPFEVCSLPLTSILIPPENNRTYLLELILGTK